MAYQSIFTPNNQKNFTSDFKPGQYAGVNNAVAQKQNALLDPAPTQSKGTSLFSKISKVAKDIGDSSITQTVARELPGGMNDVKANVQQGNQATNNIKQIQQQEAAGKLNKTTASRLINAQAASADSAQKQVKQTANDIPAPKQQGARIASDLTGGVANDIANKTKQQIKYLAQPAATSQERQQIIGNQTKAEQDVKSGKVSKPTLSLLKKNGQSAQGTVQTQKMIATGAPDKEVQKQIQSDQKAKANLDKRTLGAGVSVASALPIAEGINALRGGGELVNAAIRSGIEGGAGNAGATLEHDPNASGKQIGEATAVGTAIGSATPVVGKVLGLAAKKIFSKGAEDALSKLKEPTEAEPKPDELPNTGMKDVMTPEQADKAAAAAYTKITPKDESTGAEEVGVKTPIHAGIKQQSETYKIGVKTPTHAGIKEQSSTYNIGVSTKQSMTDDQYTKEFNSLSSAYDQEMKSVVGKPAVIQEALAGHIDNKYQVLIGDLNDRYKSGYMSEATAPKKIASETSSTKKVVSKVPAPKKIASETLKAEKPSGGVPKSGVNVPRSSRYDLGTPPDETTQELQETPTAKTQGPSAPSLTEKGLHRESQVQVDPMTRARTITDLEAPLKDLLNYPDLYKDHPYLGDIKVAFKSPGSLKYGQSGGYFPETNHIEQSNDLSDRDTISNLVHEAQHAIQEHEGRTEDTNRVGKEGGYHAYEGHPNEVEARGASLKALELIDKQSKETESTSGSGLSEPRSTKYSLDEAPRITLEKATQKLQTAGYSPEETKTILQDALPEKGLAMPGSKPRIKLNDASIQKSAANLDKSNGDVPVESSSLQPLAETATSEKGTSKLGSSVQEKALQEKLVNKTAAEDVPTYNKANMKEQAQFTSELIKSDPQRAINIALGKEEAPAHILPQMVYNGVEEYARHIGGEDGGKLLLDLSKSKQVTNLTTMAQNVRAAAERDPHSPTTMINQVAVARAEKVKGGAKAVTDAIKADAKAIRAATPKIKPDDWKDFVNGLRC